MMRFEWDEEKRLANIAKHGIDFSDAEMMFQHPMYVQLDGRFNYDEDRWIGIGLLFSRVAVVVYVERVDSDDDNSEQIIRIISLRKALKHERKLFETYLSD